MTTKIIGKAVMQVNSKNIFLIDSFGAGVSSLSLGLLLPFLQSWVGLPVAALHLLAMLAVCFMVYSFCCYKWIDHGQPIWLALLVGANIGYCIFTVFLLIRHSQLITALGLIYFTLEIFVIILLVSLEIRVLKRSSFH